MKPLSIVLVCVLASSLVITGCVGENQAAPASDADVVMTKGGDDRTGHYDVVGGWWKSAPNHDDE